MSRLLSTVCLCSAVLVAHANDDGFVPAGEESRPDAGFENATTVDDGAESEVVNGEETLEFPAVAALAVMYGSYEDTFCSGTLVSPTELITAAHCLDGMRQQMRNGAVPYAVFGGNVIGGEVSFSSKIIEWGQHPGWRGSVQAGGDIAWVRIEQPNLFADPMPLYAGQANELVKGEKFDYVGYGVTGDGRSDSGVKRTAALTYQGTQGTYLVSADSTKNVCQGDSGGAALRREDDGVWSLVGVNSYVFDTAGDGTSCITGATGSTRIDYYLDWILENTEATTDLPEPDAVAVADEANFGDWDLPQRPPEEPVGACSSAGTSGGAWLLTLLAVGLVRRRRD